MSVATGRCGRAMVSMETDPEAIRAAQCPRCPERDEQRHAWTMAALPACTALAVVFSARQMLTA